MLVNSKGNGRGKVKGNPRHAVPQGKTRSGSSKVKVKHPLGAPNARQGGEGRFDE